MYQETTSSARGVAIQLTQSQLEQATRAYQLNPDTYKGVPDKELQIMGLNPEMTLGKAGAFQLPDGTWVPKQSCKPILFFEQAAKCVYKLL